MNSARRRQRLRRRRRQQTKRRALEGWRVYQCPDERRIWLRQAREVGLR